jgi:cell division protein ZipA
MDGLRWLLLLLGLLVIAGVYLYSRRERNKSGEQSLEIERKTPTIGAEEDVPDEITGAFEEPVEHDVEPSLGEEAPQKIVTLRLIGRDGAGFKGDELILSMRGIGLRHGKFGIFHRIDGDDDERTIFSAASLIEPGSFDLTDIAEQEIPGISLFMVLPGPIDCVEAFDMMMEAARALAQSLNGELLDESGSTLSIQRERYMREEVIQYQHSNLVA